MSEQYFISCIQEILIERTDDKSDDMAIHNIRDFIHAAQKIDNIDAAEWFYEGAVEWECTRYKEDLETAQKGIRALILQSVLMLGEPECSMKQRIWYQLFNPMDELIQQKTIVYGNKS